ncbi:MAG: DUF1016 N-terminal domain-containing protein [Isosphaeraceae bacterium]
MMPRAHKTTRRTLPSPPAPPVPATCVDRLLGDLRVLIEAARSVNSALVGLYWHIGKRIREDVLQEKRAEYGEAIVSTVSKQSRWSHFVEILPLKDPLAFVCGGRDPQNGSASSRP